jgi:hypothetical protein
MIYLYSTSDSALVSEQHVWQLQYGVCVCGLGVKSKSTELGSVQLKFYYIQNKLQAWVNTP